MKEITFLIFKDKDGKNQLLGMNYGLEKEIISTEFTDIRKVKHAKEYDYSNRQVFIVYDVDLAAKLNGIEANKLFILNSNEAVMTPAGSVVMLDEKIIEIRDNWMGGRYMDMSKKDRVELDEFIEKLNLFSQRGEPR